MPASRTEEIVSSDLPDTHDLPFDLDVNIEAEEYSRIMRRIVARDGEWGTPVSSGFNSSI